MSEHNLSSNINTLADRAVLARLTRSTLRTSFRDKDLEATVRTQAGDDSITVHKHLFRDKGNRVRIMLAEAAEIYRMHMERTLPWIDRGPRLLPSADFLQYSQDMRDAIDKLTAKVPSLQADWPALVQADIASRGGAASVDDYPAQEDLPGMFSFDLHIMPLPDTKDFRVQVDEATKQSLERALAAAEQTARSDILRRMLEPLSKAADKLSVPIGEQGSIFRDSLIENIKEGLAQAKSLNIVDDPDLQAIIDRVEDVVERTVSQPDALRTQQGARDNAKRELDDLLNNLGM